MLDNDPNLILVAKEVPNNGSTKIIIPNKVSNKINFVIKAVDNIFLTTSALPSIVQNPVIPGIFVAVDNDLREICLPASPAFEFETTGLSGLTENILLTYNQVCRMGLSLLFQMLPWSPEIKLYLP